MDEEREVRGCDMPITDDARRTVVDLLGEARSAMLTAPLGAARCLQQAAALLSQGARANEQPQSTVIRGGLAPWQARRVASIIEQDLETTLSIPDLARQVSLSASYFRRAFHQTFGMAPHSYILRRRVERAKELMVRTDDGLAEIALACGLGDQSHLSRVFRRIERDSPNAWRLRNHCQPPVPAAYH